jgi:dTDP-4-amino-4,6-dideoxygalactose transaminase
MIEYENLKKLNEPFLEQYKESFSKTLESGWFILGGNVSLFEKEYAAYCGSKYCLGLASGLDALFLAIKYYDFPPGSEIIVPSNTYIATILAIIHNGFVPVLVEPELETYNIDPTLINEKITSKTRAIMVVHLYGRCCAMDQILQIADNNNLIIIEDCAQAQGAMFKGIRAGNFGDIGAHSFYPTKNLGSLGDAGAVTMNEVIIDEKIRALRNYGSKIKYVNEYAGYNSRLDEIQAGFLSIKLKHLDEINTHKRVLADMYIKNLNSDFAIPIEHSDYYNVYHIFPIRHPKRDLLRKYLLEKNIKTEIHYPIAPHKQEGMQGIIKGEFPISEEIHNTILSLPISYFHTLEDVSHVVKALNNF